MSRDGRAGEDTIAPALGERSPVVPGHANPIVRDEGVPTWHASCIGAVRRSR